MTEHVTKQKPFPWRCPSCGLKEVRPSVAPYAAEVKHDGRVHEVAIDRLEIPTCQSCGEKVFSKHVDDQISQALRRQLRLLSPNEIRSALRTLGMSQKELARRLGVAEATLSRWATGTVIQSRAMDNLLRVYFALPEVRNALTGEQQSSGLGLPAHSGEHSEADVP